MAVTSLASGSRVKFSVWESFSELWTRACEEGLLAVGVDIPIGLPSQSGRLADQQARGCLIGPPNRASSVFPAPSLRAIEAATYQKAQELSVRDMGKGLSRQSYALFPKIREVRASLELAAFGSQARPMAAEVHPEVSFEKMHGQPMSFHKGRQAGIAQRLKLLEMHFSNIVEAALFTEIPGPPAPGLDDALDAAAAAWSARRIVRGEAICLGNGEVDKTGYPMNIWV